MANAHFSGTIYVDTTGSLTAGAAARVSYILFTPDAANDLLVLRDGTDGSNPVKISIKAATAKHTVFFDFSQRPLVFSGGIYATIAANGTATIVTTSEGSTP